MTKPAVYHIPVCPFSQRLEILLALKGKRNEVRFEVIDITQPRPDWLLQKTRGSTTLPVLETIDGKIVRESLVILQYLEDIYPERPVAQRDPCRREVENMLTRMESEFANQGYAWVMNQRAELRDTFRDGMLKLYARMNEFLLRHAWSPGPFLGNEFGWAETVFTPLFMRFWFLDYYENFALPPDSQYQRVREWRDACLTHPAAQQVSREEIVKLYYDYAKGAGNGAMPPGRKRSSFSFEPHWRTRPWPPANKYDQSATDEALGL